MSAPWPFRFRAIYEVVIGATLSMSLEVENRDEKEFSFEEALHTYFAVSDIADVTISGLERTPYLDKAGGLTERTQDDLPIRFSGETDRVYLETMATCSIDDPGLQRRIVVSKDGSRSTVVWNPWIAKARAMQDFGDEEWRRHGVCRDGECRRCRSPACARRAPSHDGVAGVRADRERRRGQARHERDVPDLRHGDIELGADDSLRQGPARAGRGHARVDPAGLRRRVDGRDAARRYRHPRLGQPPRRRTHESRHLCGTTPPGTAARRRAGHRHLFVFGAASARWTWP